MSTADPVIYAALDAIRLNLRVIELALDPAARDTRLVPHAANRETLKPEPRPDLAPGDLEDLAHAAVERTAIIAENVPFEGPAAAVEDFSEIERVALALLKAAGRAEVLAVLGAFNVSALDHVHPEDHATLLAALRVRLDDALARKAKGAA